MTPARPAAYPDMMGATLAMRIPLTRHRSRARPDLAAVAEEHLDTVLRYLTHLTGSRQLAEDLTGTTFEVAVRTWDRYDPDRASPAVWLCQIARGRALDHFRAEGRRRRRDTTYASGAPDATPGPEPAGIPPALRAALARLTEAEREVVGLRVVLDLDTREAAQVLGVSPTACSSLLHRALEKLRREVGDASG